MLGITPSMSDPFESEFAEAIRALDRGALRGLQALLQEDGAPERDRLMRDLMRVPQSEGTRLLGQPLAICDTDRAARLEVLRGIRDALGDTPASGLPKPWTPFSMPTHAHPSVAAFMQVGVGYRIPWFESACLCPVRHGSI
jgi:hypothetical protein